VDRAAFNRLEVPMQGEHVGQWQIARELFQALFEKVFPDETKTVDGTKHVTATTTLDPGSLVAIESSSAVTVTAEPSILSGDEGDDMVLVNAGSYPITFKHGTAYNLQLTGGADLALSAKSAWHLVFLDGDWIQVR